GAHLTRATLLRASFYRATLTEADLTEADLTRATLIGATLTGATLTGATLNETVFSNTDLTDAKGLDSCVHSGPSTIDHRTLLKSGQLPPAFLRGCGLPDRLINDFASLVNEPSQFYSCFISYSTKDQKFAERLYADLQNKGVRCWFAPEDMKIGDEF